MAMAMTGDSARDRAGRGWQGQATNASDARKPMPRASHCHPAIAQMKSPAGLGRGLLVGYVLRLSHGADQLIISFIEDSPISLPALI